MKYLDQSILRGEKWDFISRKYPDSVKWIQSQVSIKIDMENYFKVKPKIVREPEPIIDNDSTTGISIEKTPNLEEPEVKIYTEEELFKLVKAEQVIILKSYDLATASTEAERVADILNAQGEI